MLALVWVILAYMIASTVLVLTAGPAVRPVRPQARLRRRLRALRASPRSAPASPGRHRADRVADRPGRSAAPSCSPTPRRSSPTRSRASSSGSRWARTRWSPRSAWCSGRCWAARSWRSRGTGCSGSTSRSRCRRACGAALRAARARRPDADRGLDLLGTATFVAGLTGLVLGISAAGSRGWNDPVVIGGLAGAVLLPLFVARRAPRPRADARPHDLREPHVRRRHRRRVHQRPLALRADVRVRLLLPGRAGRRPDHSPGSSSRRWRSGCSSPRRWPACGPTATARARCRRRA